MLRAHDPCKETPTRADAPQKHTPYQKHNPYISNGAYNLADVRFLLERDGLLTLSLPPEQLAAAALAPVLAAA